MEERLAKFRAFAQAARAGRRSGATPYPEEARQLAVGIAREMYAVGRSVDAVAETLGVASQTLASWTKAGRPGLRPVRTVSGCREGDGGGVERGVPRAAEPTSTAVSSTAVVVLPSGVRVEGLTVEGVISVLRAMS